MSKRPRKPRQKTMVAQIDQEDLVARRAIEAAHGDDDGTEALAKGWPKHKPLRIEKFR